MKATGQAHERTSSPARHSSSSSPWCMKMTCKLLLWTILALSLSFSSNVKNYLSAVKILFQEWQVPSVVRGLSSPAWTLTLRAISYSAGPQTDHRSAVTRGPPQAGCCLRHRPVSGPPPSGFGIWIPGLPQDLQPRPSHSSVVRPSQALLLSRCQAYQGGSPPRLQADQDPAGPARRYHHPLGCPT